jgi:hypothetical protein
LTHSEILPPIQGEGKIRDRIRNNEPALSEEQILLAADSSFFFSGKLVLVIRHTVLWIRNYFFYPDPDPIFLRVFDPAPDPT